MSAQATLSRIKWQQLKGACLHPVCSKVPIVTTSRMDRFEIAVMDFIYVYENNNLVQILPCFSEYFIPCFRPCTLCLTMLWLSISGFRFSPKQVLGADIMNILQGSWAEEEGRQASVWSFSSRVSAWTASVLVLWGWHPLPADLAGSGTTTCQKIWGA